MSRVDVSIPEELALKLSQLETHIRQLAFLRGAGVVVLVLATGLVAGFTIDLQWDVGSAARLGMLASYGICCAYAVWRYLIWPALQPLSPAELAVAVEQAYPELGDRLTSTIELNDPDLPEQFKGSALMREMLTRQALHSTQELDFTESISPYRAVRCVLLAVAAVLLLAAPFVFWPGYGLSWQRFFTPWGNHDSPGNLFYYIEDGDRVVARGSDVTLKAEPRWRRAADRLPERIRLYWTDTSGGVDSRHMEFDASQGVYTTTVPHVFEGFAYHVSSRRSRSRDYRIDVVEPPSIVRFSLHADPPAYTGLPATTFDGAVGDIRVFERSTLRFELEFNRPVVEAHLLRMDEQAESSRGINLGAVNNTNQTRGKDRRSGADSNADGKASAHSASNRARSPSVGRTENFSNDPIDVEAFTLAPDGRSATLDVLAESPGRFAIAVIDEHGLTNEHEPERNLLVVRDEPPVLTLPGSDDLQAVRPSDVVSLLVKATDDIGLGALELHYEVHQKDAGIQAVDEAMLGRPSIEHAFQLDLAALEISDGAVITYRVRAADERPVPGPNEVWSPRRVLTVDKNAAPPGSHEVARRQDELRQRLKDIRDDVVDNRDRLDELKRQADENLAAKTEFERNKDLGELSQEQHELARRIEQLAAQLEQLPLYAHLAERSQGIARQELSDSSRDLREAVQSPLTEKTEAMQESAARLSAADEKLSALADRFDELADLERDLMELERLAHQADRLAQQAAALQRRRQDIPPNETAEEKQAREQQLAREQQALDQRQAELAERLDDLLERRPEVLEAARRSLLQHLERLAQQALAIAEPQEQLAEAMSAPSGGEGETRRQGEREQGRQGDREPGSREAQVTDGPQTEAASASDQPAASGQTAVADQSATADQPASGDDGATADAGNRAVGEEPATNVAQTEGSAAAGEQRAGGSPAMDPPGADAARLAEEEGEPSRAVEAQARQRQLAQEAASLTLEVARETGRESSNTEQAIELARQSSTADRQARIGQLEQAAQSARQSAGSAQEVARNLAAGHEAGDASTAPLARRLEEFARQQSEMAAELEALAQSPAEQINAQQNGQRELSAAANELADQLGRVGQRLVMEPLNLERPGRQAQEAQARTQIGRRAMQQAEQRLRQGDAESAGQSGRQAAESLREAARLAHEAVTGQPSSDSPVPDDVADQVAAAAELLRQAQQQFAEAADQQDGQSSSGEGDSASTPMEGQQAAGGDQQSSGQPDSQNAGDSSSQSDSLQQAADALHRAFQNLQQEAGQASQQAADSQSTSDSQSGDSQAGASGAGIQTESVVDFEKLDAELERLAGRNWGQLPGRLQTEILQAAQRRPNSEYAKLIKLYFQEIADSQRRAAD
jgi:hypothetical protein